MAPILNKISSILLEILWRIVLILIFILSMLGFIAWLKPSLLDIIYLFVG